MSPPEEFLKSNELYQKGLAAVRKRNFGYAIELFKQVLVSYPQSIECRHNLWSAAREHMRFHQNRNSPRWKTNLSLPLLRFQSWYFTNIRAYNKALAAQERITLINPDNIPALLDLATLFKLTGNTAAARAACEEVLLLDKHNFKALNILAHIYFHTKQYRQAKITANLILLIDPRNLDAENILKDIAAVDSIEQGFDRITPAT